MTIAVWLYAGVALASFVSLILRRPWTSRLARRRTPPAVWTTALFLETNLVLTAVWTVLFAGGAFVAALAPRVVLMAYGLVLAVCGRLSHRVGEWYSARRLRAMAVSG